LRAFLLAQPEVSDVHDLHVWSLSTTETALTAHLVVPAATDGDTFLDRIAHELEERFGVGHATLQVEQGACRHGCEPRAERSPAA
jgi:cobalt-zinc-cadmium efflux system protein